MGPWPRPAAEAPVALRLRLVRGRRLGAGPRLPFWTLPGRPCRRGPAARRKAVDGGRSSDGFPVRFLSAPCLPVRHGLANRPGHMRCRRCRGLSFYGSSPVRVRWRPVWPAPAGRVPAGVFPPTLALALFWPPGPSRGLPNGRLGWPRPGRPGYAARVDVFRRPSAAAGGGLVAAAWLRPRLLGGRSFVVSPITVSSSPRQSRWAPRPVVGSAGGPQQAQPGAIVVVEVPCGGPAVAPRGQPRHAAPRAGGGRGIRRSSRALGVARAAARAAASPTQPGSRPRETARESAR